MDAFTVATIAGKPGNIHVDAPRLTDPKNCERIAVPSAGTNTRPFDPAKDHCYEVTGRIEGAELHAVFRPLLSWKKPERLKIMGEQAGNELLEHEQGHLCIREISAPLHTDLLNSTAVKQYGCDPRALKVKVLNELRRQQNATMLSASVYGRVMDSAYDRATDHSRNKEKQGVWNRAMFGPNPGFPPPE